MTGMIADARSHPAAVVSPARNRPRDASIRRLLAATDIVALGAVQLVVLALVGRPPQVEQLAWALVGLPL